MPFCPECKFEYRPDITKCPDCDSWLVVSLNSRNNSDRKSDSHSQSQPNSSPEYSDHIKKLMKSLPQGPPIPSGPAIPNGPLSSVSNQPHDNYDPDSNDPIAKKLSQHDSWVEIAHLPGESLSRLIADGLESVGIPCVVFPGLQAGWTFGTAANGDDGTTSDILLVPEEFVERADNEATELVGEEYENYKTPHE